MLVRQEETTAARTLAVRVAIVVGLFIAVLVVFWFDREGLKDELDGAVSFLDVVYFTMVTVTTVGYGDIVPVSDRARLIDSFFVTPIRFFVLFIFVSTAYQMVFQRMREERRMKKLEDSLSGHVIVCGFGHSGRIAAVELVAKGEKPERVVVIDQSESAARAAADAGFVALVGSCTSEEIMRRAVVPQVRALPCLVIGIERDKKRVLFWDLGDTEVKADDLMLVIEGPAAEERK